ncbi:MAG: D-alanyl-D-alanine carboxypeptidase [Desulfovibrio sp.]|nr:D-alanyl-D-alanine carboxypeptidase [Desulfovibrio sp.]
MLLAHPVLSAPRFPVRAAILYNMTTGKILYKLNPNTRIPPASLTKVMTLCLAFDQIEKRRLSSKKLIKISALAAGTGGSTMHLRRGERVHLSKLLVGTAVASGNDAATAVAQAVQPNLKKFVSMMNARARLLGMRNTSFKNPTGLPAKGQLTTAYDMLLLARYYLKNHPKAIDIHGVATFTHGGHVLQTTNALLGSVCGVNGLKTGWTVASGYNIIVTATRGRNRLICVIMGGKSRIGRDMTARQLIEAGFVSPESSAGVARILERKGLRGPSIRSRRTAKNDDSSGSSKKRPAVHRPSKKKKEQSAAVPGQGNEKRKKKRFSLTKKPSSTRNAGTSQNSSRKSTVNRSKSKKNKHQKKGDG